MSGPPNASGPQGGPWYPPPPGPPPYAPFPPSGYQYPPQPPGPLPPPPTSVVRASVVLNLMAGWGLLGLIIGLVRAPDVPASSELIRTVTTVTSALITAGIAAMYIVCAVQIRRGRNWARILPTVFAGLGMLSVPFLFLAQAIGGEAAEALDGWTFAAAAVSTALGLAFLVLVWSRSSNAFFRTAQQTR